MLRQKDMIMIAFENTSNLLLSAKSLLIFSKTKRRQTVRIKGVSSKPSGDDLSK